MVGLPDELILHILSYASPGTAWTSMKTRSKQLKSCAEDTLHACTLPATSLALTFSLGSGLHHRWYDITATLYFHFSHIDPLDSGRAVFTVDHITPEHCHQTALGKWRRLHAEDFGTLSTWRIKIDDDFQLISLQDLQARQAKDGEELSLLWWPLFDQHFDCVGEEATCC